MESASETRPRFVPSSLRTTAHCQTARAPKSRRANATSQEEAAQRTPTAPVAAAALKKPPPSPEADSTNLTDADATMGDAQPVAAAHETANFKSTAA